MINKNFYRKTNDKKVLHKVGKQWKVISVALLMAIGGGAAVATHANAQSTPTGNNSALINSLETPPTVQKASAGTSSSASASVSAQPTIPNTAYESGNNGSAAKYHNSAVSASVQANNYNNTVKTYVNSLNQEFAPQVNSLNGIQNSAAKASNGDSSLANSYSNVAKNNSSKVSSLAAKSGISPELYTDYAQYSETNYSNGVKNASADVKANSLVSSIASKIVNENPTYEKASASTNSALASYTALRAEASSSNVDNAYTNAKATSASVAVADANLVLGDAQVDGNNGNNNYLTNYALSLANSFVNSSATAAGTYNAGSSLATESGFIAATLNNSLTSNVNTIVSSVEKFFNSNVAFNTASFGNYNTNTHNFVSNLAGSISDASASSSSNGYSMNTTADVTGSAASAFHSAVSYAANNSIAAFLNGKAGAAKNANAAISAQASTASKAASSKASVASTAVRVAKIQSNIAAANSVVADFVNYYGGDHTENGLASLASTLLSNGAATDLASLSSFASTSASADFVAAGSLNNKPFNFNDILASIPSARSQITSASSGLTVAGLLEADGVMSSAAQDTTANFTDKTYSDLNNALSSAVSGLSSAASAINSASFSASKTSTQISGIQSNGDFQNGSNASQVVALYTTNGTSSAAVVTDAMNNTSLTSGMSTNATQVINILKAAASSIADVHFNDATDLNNAQVSLAFASDGFKSAAKAALLSDGIDYDELNREASGIADVASAEFSVATSSDNIKNESSAAKLSDALNVAASSANSSLGTAQQSLASYNASADVDVTLASYFANSYSSDAKSESNVASSASSALNSFYNSTIDSTAFTSANNAMNSAKTTEINDNNLAKAYGINVFNYSPKYVTLLRNAGLYNQGTRFPLPKGAVLEVTGVKIGKLGRLNYVTNYKGHEGTVYAGPSYVRQTYLDATDTPVDITVNGSREVYSSADFSKSATGQKVSNTTLKGCTVVNPTGTYKGFTAVRTPSGNYITANTSYVTENNGSTTPSKQPTTPTTPTTPSKPSNNPYGEVNF